MALATQDDVAEARRWRGWVRAFALTAVALAAAVAGFIVLLDPYGARIRPGMAPRPLMDINQRFMYPQLVRSGRFDSAVLGTSTLRLIDPAALSRARDASFVNLAMNAATPWEQTEVARLFIRGTPAPRAIIWGLDSLWCEADATAPEKRLTPRPFPPWLYDEARWNDWPHQFNFTTIEIAVRLAGARLGLLPERIRGDGYEVFTPPEASYDLSRARYHLYRLHGGQAPDLTPLRLAEAVPEAVRAAWRFPALEWLDATLAQLPDATERLLVLPPVHASALPREGTEAAQRQAACKERIAAIARRHHAGLVDYAFASALTREETNYWDPLHYRLPIARMLEGDLASALRGDAPPAARAAQLAPVVNRR